MAPLLFEFEWSQFFSIFGPLGVSINIEFGAEIDFDFGYDTLGIQQFVEGGFLNPGALLNGFFIGDEVDLRMQLRDFFEYFNPAYEQEAVA